jgi:hypothetical protein
MTRRGPRAHEHAWLERESHAEQCDLEALRTQVANQAASLAETFNDGFEGFHLGAGDYIVQLTAPEGQSTGGGVRARQHIRLVPRRKGYTVVVAGTVDPVTSTAEVRTFEHVAVLHEVRFGRPLEIDIEEYAGFLAKLEVALGLARIRSSRVGPSKDVLDRARVSLQKRRAPAAALVLFAVVLVLAAMVAFRVMQTMGR